MSSEGLGAPSARAGGAEALAVVVTAGVTPYLRRTLRAVARQTVAPEATIVVDVASRHNGLGDGTPVEEIIAASARPRRQRLRRGSTSWSGPVRRTHRTRRVQFAKALALLREAAGRRPFEPPEALIRRSRLQEPGLWQDRWAEWAEHGGRGLAVAAPR